MSTFFYSRYFFFTAFCYSLIDDIVQRRLEYKRVSEACSIHTVQNIIMNNEGITRKKQARFRWFVAYTIIKNRRLFNQRKQVLTSYVRFLFKHGK